MRILTTLAFSALLLLPLSPLASAGCGVFGTLCASATAQASTAPSGFYTYTSDGWGSSALGAAVVTLSSTKTGGATCLIIAPLDSCTVPTQQQNGSAGCNTVTVRTALLVVGPAWSDVDEACAGTTFDDPVGIVLEAISETNNEVWSTLDP